ncbi:sorbose reductase SOU1 [Pyricularia oryzae Y34]|uniref:Sorbose reductase SOU1 n=1 Tax=Pyricularia oryzae (strain Y34) TaxID=1143189 RepID=A0AA97NUC0_PYRO3|nr:sorbose reductase SOU1 [Pyricularia oryzae Y34]
MLSLSRTAPRLATRCRTTTTTRPLLATLATTQQPSKPRFSSSGATTSLPEFSLKDKVLVVSGGGRGLGLVQAEALLEAGAREVHAIDRLTSPGEDFARVADKFSAASGSGSALQYHRIDVRESEALNGAVEAIAERHGRIDGLVAAAGVQQATPALEYNQEDSDRMLGINVTGVFMTAQAVARQMVRLEQGGSIALIASMSGTIANRVIQLGRNLASEWGQLGIRVNTISPGYIVTAMTEDLFKEHPEFRTNWTKENMLGRLSTPEEYRGAAVFLLSDASSFMTGSDLRIDGGHAAW